MRKKQIIFFIGTIAEYIKLFTVIEEAKRLNIDCKIISSGQNEIITSDIALKTGLKIDLQLSYEKDIVKNAFGLFYWFFKTMLISKKKIADAFDDVDFENSVMVVHGDTLSTVMGAVLGKSLKMKIAHVESGLRSHRLFTPFPEEIDRLTVSKIASYNFCQSEEAKKNLEKAKGAVIDTKYNTILDAIRYAKTTSISNKLFDEIIKEPYCIFVIHRQENLIKPALVKKVVDKAIEVSKTKRVVFVMHKITENTLIKLNLIEKLNNAENITAIRRAEYFDFMKLLINSDFVVTDGGSNQEELHYLGKPTLILRTATERNEGIGENALLFKNDLSSIDKFLNNYTSYKTEPVSTNISPSKLIIEYLLNETEG